MKTSIRLAALLLSGAVFIGCDKKDTTSVTAPDGSKTTTVSTPDSKTTTITTPTTPDTSKVGSAINNAIDKTATGAKTEADKLMPTTMPTLPK